MGHGTFTMYQILELKKNPYVENVTERRITYTEEFKRLFIKEYFEGKKPMRIFSDAGFDIKVIGSKRIERCSARWREANAVGRLGTPHKNNNFHEKNENEKQEMLRIIREQQKEIEVLKKELEER